MKFRHRRAAAPRNTDEEKKMTTIDDMTSSIEILNEDIDLATRQLSGVRSKIDKMMVHAKQGRPDAGMAGQLALSGEMERKLEVLSTRRQELLAKRDNLIDRQFEIERFRAMAAYSEAVKLYADACRDLLPLADAVRELAPAAGLGLAVRNSPGLIGRELLIAGAVVNL